MVIPSRKVDENKLSNLLFFLRRCRKVGKLYQDTWHHFKFAHHIKEPIDQVHSFCNPCYVIQYHHHVTNLLCSFKWMRTKTFSTDTLWDGFPRGPLPVVRHFFQEICLVFSLESTKFVQSFICNLNKERRQSH